MEALQSYIIHPSFTKGGNKKLTLKGLFIFDGNMPHQLNSISVLEF